MIADDRSLAWEGCLNVRDLGGLPTEDGAEIRRGALVRGDNARRLSDEAWRAVVAHGVRTVLDLRFSDEVATDPPGELPVEVVHVSVLGEPDPDYAAGLDARLASLPDEVAHTREAYLEFLVRNREAFARAISAVAAASPGGVLVHCMEGKDRTGLVAAMLLSLAGVEAKHIGSDYSETDVQLAQQYEVWIGEATPEDQAATREELRCPPERILGVLDHIERGWGGVAGYLDAAGLAPQAIDRLSSKLSTSGEQALDR